MQGGEEDGDGAHPWFPGFLNPGVHMIGCVVSVAGRLQHITCTLMRETGKYFDAMASPIAKEVSNARLLGRNLPRPGLLYTVSVFYTVLSRGCLWLPVRQVW